MTAKRPKNMTYDEWDSLPVFGFGVRTEVREGVTIRIPVMPEVGATWFEEDEPPGYVDHDGTRWRFGQYLDGAWYKRRAG